MYVKQLLAQSTRILSVLVFIILSSTTITAMAASVTLRWDPNDPAPDGYRVFVRRSDQAYDYRHPDWEGASTTCIIENLDDQTDYYFVVRAYDGNLESADSAEVGYTTPADNNPVSMTDTDGDGMSDAWEILYGLDPTSDDANDDLDGDGISNRDEYRAGLEPDEPGVGTAPTRPQPVSPIDYTQVERRPVLTAADYDDPDGDAHIATQWQIFDADTGGCLLDVISDRRLARLTIPRLLLNGGMTCSWRLRFYDSGGQVSAWSHSAYFTTLAAANDLDGNGIPDDQENVDGTIDTVQTLTSIGAALEPTGMAVISADTVSDIEQMETVDPEDFETDETTPSRLPTGMAAYKLVLYEAGQTAQVTVHLSAAAPAGARWVKYDAINAWQDYSPKAVFSSDRRTVTVDLKDGGFGDADGVANGIIIDPSGLLLADEASSATSDNGGTSGGSGGGGCFITSTLGVERSIATGDGFWQWLGVKMQPLMKILFRDPSGR